MRKTLYSSVDKPVEELATLVYHHFGKAPMGWTGIDKLTEYAHNEQFVERVLALYQYVSTHNELLRGINPSQYYKIFYKYQLASKSLPIDAGELTNCYHYLANCAIRTYNRNLTEIEEAIKERDFSPINSVEIAQRVSLLSALLRSFSETLYCDEHTIAGEIYSPIEYGDSTYIVRKYIMLNAKELRSELADCPVSGINIYCEYQGLSQKPVTDIVGNLLITENILPKIKSFRVEIVDLKGVQHQITDSNCLGELIQYFQTIIPKLVGGYKGMAMEDRLWKKIECEYYALKPFCEAVGVDWQPKKYELDIEKISNPLRPIVKANLELLTLTDKDAILHKLIELNDPRIHW